MKQDRTKYFMEAIREASRYFKHLSPRVATIVHHNDTDGISAGAILKRALQRERFQTENIPLEKIHPSLLSRIHQPHRKLILYADFGEQVAGMISKKRLTGQRVIILDHHPPLGLLDFDLLHINPERFDIDGDMSCSGATVAYLFARALNRENDDLSYLGVLGALGDGQFIKGRVRGLNRVAMEDAMARGLIRLLNREGLDPYCFPLFKNESGMKVVRSVSELSVNGYYRRGADLAIRVCLQGYTARSIRFGEEMRGIQEERFQKEKRRLQHDGISSEGEIQWVDVRDRFFPLGLKSIGLFCDEIMNSDWIDEGQYLVGFQNFPKENPYLGRLDEKVVKVSMRVPPALRHAIEKGERPDLTEILPQASEEAGGFAEGCHRYIASCIIHRERKKELIRALSKKVKKMI